jgi:hypothetical protein
MTLASHLCLIGTRRKILNAFPIGNLDHRRCGPPLVVEQDARLTGAPGTKGMLAG